MYDLSSGEVFELNKVEKELLPFIKRMELPLPPVCPSTLRYSLAKYKVSEIYSAYDRLISLINTKNLVINKSDYSPTEAFLNLNPLDDAFCQKIIPEIINNLPSVVSFILFPPCERADTVKGLILRLLPSADVKIKNF